MDVLDVVIKIWVWLYEMVPVCVFFIVVFLLSVIIANVVIERRDMPWEKAEKKAAKKAAQAKEKARRDFWSGKRV